MSDPLFGRYCYIDTPWIAGKKTVYRIISSGCRSNTWSEVPAGGKNEKITHDWEEDVVYVVLNTLVSDDSIIYKFARKDIELIEPQNCDTCRYEKDMWYSTKCDGCCKGNSNYEPIDDEPQEVWEDIFQIYKRCGNYEELIAGDMSLYDATLFMRAWMEDHYADQTTRLELRRQPIRGEEND